MAFARLLLVLSSLSPVFLMWAIRGVDKVDWRLWSGLCLMLFSITNLATQAIFYRARISRNTKSVIVKGATDHREQLITYLLAMLVPLIEVSFNGSRDAIVAGMAFSIVCAMFWFMDLHYMNFFFLLRGYRIFELSVDDLDTFARTSEAKLVLISKREQIRPGTLISAYRVAGSIMLEKVDNDQGVLLDGKHNVG